MATDEQVDETPKIVMPKLVAAQSKQAVSQKRSIFMDDRSSYAGKVTYDGYTFYFNPMSEELADYENKWAYMASELAGIPVDILLGNKVVNVDPETSQMILSLQTDLWEKIINECLVKWTAPVDLSPDRIAQLYKDVKRTISDAIVAFSKYGLSEEEFFRSRHS